MKDLATTLVVARFLDRYEADAFAGRRRPRSYYLELFPAHREVIAAHYDELDKARHQPRTPPAPRHSKGQHKGPTRSKLRPR